MLYQVEVLHLVYSSTLSIRAQDLAMQYIEVVLLSPQVLDDFEVTPTASILPAAV